MNEIEAKIEKVLNNFNKTFVLNIDMSDIDNEVQEEQQEQMVTKVTITDIYDDADGSEFVESFCSLFGPLIEQMSNGTKAMVFEENKGLAIRRIDD